MSSMTSSNPVKRIPFRYLLLIFAAGLFLAAIFCLLFLSSLPRAHATGWYNAAWQYRKAITIPAANVASSTGSETYSNFPLLINLASDTNLAAYASSTGGDILFTAGDGTTKLNHEIESYSSSTGALVAWVQVPSLSTTTTSTFYIYYDNPLATSQQSPTSTWDSHYVAVYHLPNGTTLSGNDSTVNGYNLTNSSTTATTGEIDGGASFATTTDSSLANTSFYNSALSNITMSFWVKPGAGAFTGSYGPPLMSWGDCAHGNGYCVALFGSSGGGSNLLVDAFASGGDVEKTGGTLTAGVWSFVTVTYNAGTSIIYVNGSVANSGTTSGSITPGGSYLTLGNNDENLNNPFLGSMDEARISTTVRSADWIMTEYKNQSSPATFYTLGSAQTNSSPPTIVSFSASPLYIASGSSTLSWFVGGATTVSIDHGVGSQASTTLGSASVSPVATTVYTLTANNTFGTSTATTSVIVDTTPPSTPTGLTANATSSSQINLAWTASTDSGGSGLAGYNIFRCTGSSCTPSTKVATSSVVSYADTGLLASTTYTYAVSAFDGAGNVSATSTTATATTQAKSTSTTVVLMGQTYTLEPHPRVYLDGPNGALTQSLLNTNDKASSSNPFWQGVLDCTNPALSSCWGWSDAYPNNPSFLSQSVWTIGGRTLTNIVVSSGIATVTVSAPHKFIPNGAMFTISGATVAPNLNGTSTIIAVPTEDSFTLSEPGVANGTYTDSGLQVSAYNYQQPDFTYGMGMFLVAALKWYVTGDPVALQAAKWGVDHFEDIENGSFACSEDLGHYCDGRLYDVDYGRFDTLYPLQEFSILHNQLSPSEISTFADKMLNDAAYNSSTNPGGLGMSVGSTTSCTAEPMSIGTGTISDSGTDIITGVGTHFTTQLTQGAGIWPDDNINNGNEPRITYVIDDTHARVLNDFTFASTNFHYAPMWQAGDCGWIWMLKHDPVEWWAQPGGPYGAGGSDTNRLNGQNAGNALYNLMNHSWDMHISMGLALADDDPRAVTDLEQTYNDWYTWALPTMKSGWTGITQSGMGYGPVFESGEETRIIESLNSSIISPPPELTSGNFIKRTLAIGPWYSSAAEDIVDGSPSSSDSYADGLCFDGSAVAGQQCVGAYANAWDPGEYYVFADYLYSGSLESDAFNWWFNKTYIPGRQVLGGGASYLPYLFMFYDPQATQTDPNTVNHQYAFWDTDYTRCVSEGFANCTPGVAFSYVTSKTGFDSGITEGTDTTMVLGAASAPGWDSHVGNPAGALWIAKGDLLLGGDGAYGNGNGQGADVQRSTIYIGGISNWNGAFNNSGGSLVRWAGVDPTGVPSNNYAYAMVNLLPSYIAGVTRAERECDHFKKAGDQDYIVCYDNTALSAATSVVEYFHYLNNGEVASSGLWSEGLTSFSDTSKTVLSSCGTDDCGLASAFLPVTNQIHLYTDNPDGTYPGGEGNSYRLSVCPSTNGGSACSGTVTSTEIMSIQMPALTRTPTLPPITQPACAGVGGSCTVVQIADPSSPKVAMFARQGTLLTGASFTTTHAGTAQYVIAGLAPGTYNVTVGSTTVLSNAVVNPNDDTLYFESTAGDPDITQATTSPTIFSFTSSPASIISGASSTLSWNTANASSVAISPGSFSTSTMAGSLIVFPTSTTTYTLTAMNGSGSVTATTSVAVSGASVPSAPQSLSATPHNASVSLTWSAPSSNGGSLLTQYLVYDRFTGSSTFAQYATTSASTLSLSVTSLTNAQPYDFEVLAQNAVGTSTPSNVVSSTPYTVPNAPTSVSASAGNAEATISFTPGSNNGSTILYYTAASSPGNISATSSGSPVIVSSLTNGQAYTFTVTATNAAGASASSSASNSVTPSNLDPIISSFTSIPAFIQPGMSSTLAWTTTLATTLSISQGIGSESATSTGSVTISPTSTATYILTATNSNGSSTAQTTITVDGIAPSIPTNLAASPVSQSEIDLSWSSSTDNIAVAGYDIYRNATKVATTTNLSYPDTGLSANTSYSYTVDAFDAAGNVSGESSSTSATTQSSSGGGGSPSGGGGGGGGGGGSVFYTPPITPSSSIAAEEALLASLEAELQALLAEAASRGVTTGTPYPFSRNLTIGSVGSDVQALQELLNSKGFFVSLSGSGSPGHETTFFGSKTAAALALFQKSVGITPNSGYFGPKTRAYLVSIGEASVSSAPTAPVVSVPTKPVVTPKPVVTTQPATPSAPASTPSSGTLSLGSTGSSVTTLQDILVLDGYLFAGTFTSGTFDPATLRALETFQCFEGIACSASTPGYGSVGAKTRAALGM